MKYIRTKDGIFRVWNWWNNSGSIPEPDIETIGCYIGNGKDIQIEEIIKQADTIEELCDEFVVIGIFENQIGCCCDTFKEAKELKDYEELPQEQNIYGAIWTDKGLIYVAKLNEKGELELI